MPPIETYNFTYPVEDRAYLLMLLQEWEMEVFYDKFIDEMITIPVLKIIQKHDIDELMAKFPRVPIGIKALFKYKLQRWKNNNPVNHAEMRSLHYDS